MIGVEQARSQILRRVRSPRPRFLPLSQAGGLVLAKDLRAPFALPHWHNSAMDGYALRVRDLKGAGPRSPVRLEIRGEVRAGDRPFTASGGGCWRIMTGAPLPKGLDSVLPVEKARLDKGCLMLSFKISKGLHVRRKGEEFRRGALALQAGSVLGPGALGFLAGLGQTGAWVFPRPRVALLSTGDELVAPGKSLRPGLIYDANSAALSGAVQEAGGSLVLALRVPDKVRLLKKALVRAMDVADLILMGAGVSMGRYDHSRKVLASAGLRRVFWGVAQKPGKPLYFGVKGPKMFFGLPGNPVSALVCFHEYVRPALQALLGHERIVPPGFWVRSLTRLRPDPSKTLFLRGLLKGDGPRFQVRILRGQGSHMMSALAKADCLVMVPPGRQAITKVLVHPLLRAGAALS